MRIVVRLPRSSAAFSLLLLLGTPLPVVPLFTYPYKLPHVSENFHIGPNSHHHPGHSTHSVPTWYSHTHAH